MPLSSPALLRAADSLLLVVDAQERLAAAMLEGERARVERACGLLVQAACTLAVPVVVSEQYPVGLGGTIASIQEHLPANVQVHAKTAFSCCSDANLLEHIARTGRGQVVVVGMESHVCVLQTALELVSLGYEVHVAADAVCSRNPENSAVALERLRTAGAVVSCAESVIFEWLRDAAHPKFRAVSTLVKAWSS